jgi:carbon-monoxide dehydrogenase medium subunit
MLLPKFDYHEPSTLFEACQIMADLKEQVRPLAGGTDLLVNMKNGLLKPKHVLSLGSIEELGIMEPGETEIRIGACVKIARIAGAEGFEGVFRGVKAAAENLGSPLIRNLATIGGNLLSARPAADTPPALIAHDAYLVLKKAAGERTVSLDEFFLGPGQTATGPDEILTEIVIPRPPTSSGSAYMKLGVRKAMEIALVNVAAFLSLDEKDQTIKKARVVLGAVAPIPLRSPSAEAVLVGRKPDQALFDKAADAAAGDSRPIDDFRGSAAYRRDMVRVLAGRVLHTAYQQAQGHSVE